MPILKQKIVVFDFETTSNARDCEIVQVGACVLDPVRLAVVDEFESLVRPSAMGLLTAGAVDVHGKTAEVLEAAPEAAEVWHRFATWVAQWNVDGRASVYTVPIPAGHGLAFDWPIYERYALKYGTTRKAKNGDVEPAIFNNSLRYDTYCMLAAWTENLADPARLKMDFLRKYFAMPVPPGGRAAHDALRDVRDTAAILAKLLALHRASAPKVIWERCFDDEFVSAEKERRSAAKRREKERRPR